MKKIISAAWVFALLLSACSAIPFPGAATPTPPIQPTIAPPTEIQPPPPTPTPVLSNPSETPASASATPENTTASTTVPNLTTTVTTATDLPINPTVTAPVTVVAGAATATPTLGILTYGTLPPAVPFNTITVWNRSRAQAYISLQVTMNDGRYAIIEYPVEGRITIKAPTGSYIYVAWVGGNKMSGGFRNHASDNWTIILFKDKVVIK